MNPGSYEAIMQGCTCDLLVNHRGHGTGELRNGKPVFIYDPACTVHKEQVSAEASSSRTSRKASGAS